MIQKPSQEEIEKGLAEFKGDYKRLLRNITNCLEFDYKGNLLAQDALGGF